jgi:hypothetical protein
MGAEYLMFVTIFFHVLHIDSLYFFNMLLNMHACCVANINWDKDGENTLDVSKYEEGCLVNERRENPNANLF